MAATRAFGTTLTKMPSGSETEPIVVANLTSIGEIGLEWEELDVTDFDSEDYYREFIATVKDAGEVPIAGYIKSETNMETLLAVGDSGSVEDWRVDLPGGQRWSFKAFLKIWKEGELTVDGVRNIVGSLRVSGKPVYESTPAS